MGSADTVRRNFALSCCNIRRRYAGRMAYRFLTDTEPTLPCLPSVLYPNRVPIRSIARSGCVCRRVTGRQPTDWRVLPVGLEPLSGPAAVAVPALVRVPYWPLPHSLVLRAGQGIHRPAPGSRPRLAPAIRTQGSQIRPQVPGRRLSDLSERAAGLSLLQGAASASRRFYHSLSCHNPGQLSSGPQGGVVPPA